MNLASSSKAYELAEAADGTLSVTNQSSNFTAALTNGLLAPLNGGKTGCTGLAHTIVSAAWIVGGAVVQKKIDTGSFGLPFVNA